MSAKSILFYSFLLLFNLTTNAQSLGINNNNSMGIEISNDVQKILTINPDTSIGIGTLTPSANLDIVGGNPNDTFLIKLKSAGKVGTGIEIINTNIDSGIAAIVLEDTINFGGITNFDEAFISLDAKDEILRIRHNQSLVELLNNEIRLVSDTTTMTGKLNFANEMIINGTPGSGGQILKSQGAGSPPIWSTPSVGVGDNLGDHTATQNIELNGNWLSNDGSNEGIFVDVAGNVGIGTNSTSALLAMNSNSVASSFLSIQNTNNSNGNSIFNLITNGSGNGINVSQTGFGKVSEFSISNSNNSASALLASSNGTNSKTAEFNHTGSTNASTDYAVYATAIGGGTSTKNIAGYFSASGAVDNYAAIFENGNVGIGTSSPSETLDINGNAIVNGQSAFGSATINTDELLNLQTNLSRSINSLNTYSGSSDKYGFYNELNASGTGSHYGISNRINGNSIASTFKSVYGVRNWIYDGGDFEAYGVMNSMYSNGSGDRIGTYNYVVSGNTGEKYGTRNELNENGLTLANAAPYYGVSNTLTTKSTANITMYGIRNMINNNGTGSNPDSYGIYTSFGGTNSNGTNYGIYLTGEDINYFSGNVGINVPNPAARLDVNGTIKITDGSEGNGRVLTSDALGVGTWQAPYAPEIAMLASTSNATIPLSYTPINFDTQQRLDAAYTHSVSVNNDQITVNQTGDYKISYTVNFTSPVAGGANRSTLSAAIFIDGSQMPNSISNTYMRHQNDAQDVTNSVTTFASISSGQVITIRVQTSNSAVTDNLVPNECWVLIEKL